MEYERTLDLSEELLKHIVTKGGSVKRLPLGFYKHVYFNQLGKETYQSYYRYEYEWEEGWHWITYESNTVIEKLSGALNEVIGKD